LEAKKEVAEAPPKDIKVQTQYTKLSGPKKTGETIDLSKFNKPKKKKEDNKPSSENKRKRRRISKTITDRTTTKENLVAEDVHKLLKKSLVKKKYKNKYVKL